MKQSMQKGDRCRVIYPRGDRSRSRAGLWPAELLYRAASGAVRLARRRTQPLWSDTVVTSIGNLEVGGNGKTPFAVHVLERLVAGGCRVVYVSRGFSGSAERLAACTVVPAREAHCESDRGTDKERGLAGLGGIRVIQDRDGDVYQALGDEGAMVAMRLPQVPMVLCRDKRRAVDVARRLFRPTHIILDDAFQSWSCPRHVDVVLLDAANPLGNGRLLPAGTLREGAGALRRADMVGFNLGASPRGDSFDGDELARRRRWLLGLTGRDMPVFGLARRLAFYRPGEDGVGAAPAGPVVSLSSIARPQRFDDVLVASGWDVRLSIRYPDHHRYSESDGGHIESLLRAEGIPAVVTTEKDWVKLRALDGPVGNVWVARLEMDVAGDDPIERIEKPQAMRPAALS